METLFVLGTVLIAVVALLVVGFSLMVFVSATENDSLEHLGGEDELDKR